MSSSSKSSKSTATSPSSFYQKSASVRTCVEHSVYQERMYVNVRDWVKRKGDEDYKPTPKGMAIPVELWPQFQKLVADFKFVMSSSKGQSKPKLPPSAKDASMRLKLVYVPLEWKGEEIPTKKLIREIQGLVDKDMAVSSLRRLTPTKGFVAYAAKVVKGKVIKVKRYAIVEKKEGTRSWKKL